ncbi:protein phosphatase 2C domain-containing protein [Streptomyces sp. 4N509B]|uniref:protein phosphatase 2C domain-containing protein n=1 Tax=Streptomyces sp. 4N509B TaxID=3457413 RepID=UPI003FD0E2CD
MNDAWEVIDAGVKGLKKEYSQDCRRARVEGGGRAAVLAVADGHGSAAHFRSDLGSRWAVEEFTACAREFVRRLEDGGDEGSWRRLHATARELPRWLVLRWRRRVAFHEANAPSDGTRLATGPRGPTAGGPPDARTYEVYGSTFVGAVVTRELLVCWQIGDGDVSVVWDDGRPEALLDSGPEIGDETESLCQSAAWRRFRVHWQPLTGPSGPPAVLLSTDGLSKSFAHHAGFLEFAAGVRERVVGEGTAAVREQLAGWLTKAATHSGDDATLVAAFPAEPAAGRGDAGPDAAARTDARGGTRTEAARHPRNDTRDAVRDAVRGTPRDAAHDATNHPEATQAAQAQAQERTRTS